MTVWTGIEEGDRVLVSTTSGPFWGSILSTRDKALTSVPYEVLYDDFPDEIRWVGDDDIIRLHRGAGPTPPSSEQRETKK
jgi:hypothetical protein